MLGFRLLGARGLGLWYFGKVAKEHKHEYWGLYWGLYGSFPT